MKTFILECGDSTFLDYQPTQHVKQYPWYQPISVSNHILDKGHEIFHMGNERSERPFGPSDVYVSHWRQYAKVGALEES